MPITTKFELARAHSLTTHQDGGQHVLFQILCNSQLGDYVVKEEIAQEVSSIAEPLTAHYAIELIEGVEGVGTPLMSEHAARPGWVMSYREYIERLSQKPYATFKDGQVKLYLAGTCIFTPPTAHITDRAQYLRDFRTPLFGLIVMMDEEWLHENAVRLMTALQQRQGFLHLMLVLDTGIKPFSAEGRQTLEKMLGETKIFRAETIRSIKQLVWLNWNNPDAHKPA